LVGSMEVGKLGIGQNVIFQLKLNDFKTVLRFLLLNVHRLNDT